MLRTRAPHCVLTVSAKGHLWREFPSSSNSDAGASAATLSQAKMHPAPRWPRFEPDTASRIVAAPGYRGTPHVRIWNARCRDVHPRRKLRWPGACCPKAWRRAFIAKMVLALADRSPHVLKVRPDCPPRLWSSTTWPTRRAQSACRALELLQSEMMLRRTTATTAARPGRTGETSQKSAPAAANSAFSRRARPHATWPRVCSVGLFARALCRCDFRRCSRQDWGAALHCPARLPANCAMAPCPRSPDHRVDHFWFFASIPSDAEMASASAKSSAGAIEPRKLREHRAGPPLRFDVVIAFTAVSSRPPRTTPPQPARK